MKHLLLILMFSSACCYSDEIKRPKYPIDLSHPFSTESIAPYDGNHEKIYAHIDANIEQHTSALQRWMRQPSISAQNVGVKEMAEMVRDDLSAIGFQEANLVKTDGHPGVWGYYDAGADKTLMVYMMYDVQPVNPEDWQSPPEGPLAIASYTGRSDVFIQVGL